MGRVFDNGSFLDLLRPKLGITEEQLNGQNLLAQQTKELLGIPTSPRPRRPNPYPLIGEE